MQKGMNLSNTNRLLRTELPTTMISNNMILSCVNFIGTLCYKHQTSKDVDISVNCRGCQIAEASWAFSREEFNYGLMVRRMKISLALLVCLQESINFINRHPHTSTLYFEPGRILGIEKQLKRLAKPYGMEQQDSEKNCQKILAIPTS